MSEQDMNKIKKLAEGHTMTPRPEAWNSLRSKLKAKRAKRRLLTYRNISVAAILISILSVTAVFNMYLGNHNPKVFSSNEQYRPVMFEDIFDTSDDPMYDGKYIDQLNSIHAKVDFPQYTYSNSRKLLLKP